MLQKIMHNKIVTLIRKVGASVFPTSLLTWNIPQQPDLGLLQVKEKV